MQPFGYCYVHVSGQRQADLEIKQLHDPCNYGARDARAFYVFCSF